MSFQYYTVSTCIYIILHHLVVYMKMKAKLRSYMNTWFHGHALTSFWLRNRLLRIFGISESFPECWGSWEIM